jgi:hypothetical protein
MRIKDTYKIINNNGDTSDIINVVMMAYGVEKDPQIKALAYQLQGSTDTETCHNIWQYLIDNVTYRADTGKQEIRTPARLINDRTGDCKSYSLFTACILRYLGINHVFRFVSYDTRKEATHVYVVANQNIIVDAVSNVQAGYPFNQEIKYTYHCDMSNQGTTIAYLAGIPAYKKYRSRIGDTTIPDQVKDRYKVWIGNETESNITPGKHYLYALFDLNLELLNIAKTEIDQASYFDQLDIIASLLHSYNHVNGDSNEFGRMAFIICGMISEGLFTNSATDEDIRANKLDDLFLLVDDRYHSGYFPEKYDLPTWDMITHEVSAHNEVIPRTNGIGSYQDDVISKTKESGIYFIYKLYKNNYMMTEPSRIAKLPDVVKTRLDCQEQTHAWVSAVNSYQTPNTQTIAMVSGCIARTGMTPVDYVNALQEGKNPPVAIGIVLTTIIAVISIITGLVALFKAIFPPSVTKPTDTVITTGAFDPNTDFSKVGTTSTTTSSFTSLALPIAVAGAILFSLFSKKK